MAATKALDALRKRIQEASKCVDDLKAARADATVLGEAIDMLRSLKLELKDAVSMERGDAAQIKEQQIELRSQLEIVLKNRFIVVPSFEIYGGVAGLYDYGPAGTAIKENLIDFWRKHFVLYEQMLEVSTAALTLDQVLQTSGHVERFTDFMVYDVKTKDPFRADKLLEEHIDKLLEDEMLTEDERKHLTAVRNKADDYSGPELHEVFQKYGVKAPGTGNDLTEPLAFNLMFDTMIGPSGKMKGYMRPETAQGIFTNFKRLLDANGTKMPFAAAQVGLAFRNEISPRSGLLRVREFTLAEIEHFVHPDHKECSRFFRVADTMLSLLPRENQGEDQTIVEITAGEAVAKNIIDNETLAYYMVRTQMFLTEVGIKRPRLRFRQHKATEMAHYASDCWDAEIQCSYGWIECVGHADRSCFDLTMHAKASKVDLSAREEYSEPREIEQVVRHVNRGKLGPKFRKDAKAIASYLEELPKNQALELERRLAQNGKASITLCTGQTFEISRELVKFSVEKKIITGASYVPGVIEPSFGIGRIVYCILEHSFWVRDASESPVRSVLSLPCMLAATKVAVLPLSNSKNLVAFVEEVSHSLLSSHISVKEDASGASIGKRYARADELGIPFCVTIDFETCKTNAVTIRERDSTNQIRVSIAECPNVLKCLVNGELTWENSYAKFEKFFVQQA